MKINLVNYEERYGIKDGILTKFAQEMDKALREMGQTVSISSRPDPKSDINHHINYLPYEHTDTINTLMVTHLLDNKEKTKTLLIHMKEADMGICMSTEMKDFLSNKKIPIRKLSSVLPPHHRRERRPIIIAICTKVYSDGCKREWMLRELCKTIDKKKVAFRVMGDGWKPMLEELVKEGVLIDYCNHFDENVYGMILDSSDYYLYFGLDEGSMGTVDALNAGLKVITTPIGFHKELPIDYSFTTQEELNDVFKAISENAVKDMTWHWYAGEHLKIWKKLYEKRAKK